MSQGATTPSQSGRNVVIQHGNQTVSLSEADYMAFWQQIKDNEQLFRDLPAYNKLESLIPATAGGESSR